MAGDAVDRDEFHAVLRDLRADMREERGEFLAEVRRGNEAITDRLDELNGRTRKSESAIAVLQDRSVRTVTKGGTYGAVGGGVIGGLIYALAKLFGGTP